jgi:hypothetical protein
MAALGGVSMSGSLQKYLQTLIINKTACRVRNNILLIITNDDKLRCRRMNVFRS